MTKSVRTPAENASRTWNGYLLALKEARELGVTSIQIPGNADFGAYEKLRKEGELTTRIDIGKPLTGDTLSLKNILRSRRDILRRETGSGSVTLKHLLTVQ